MNYIQLFQNDSNFSFKYIKQGYRALHAHLLFQLSTFSFCIQCKIISKNFADLKKKIRGFLKFNDNQIFGRQIFDNLIIHKPSLGSRDVPHKIWSRSVQPFWRLLETNTQAKKHTDKQSIYKKSIFFKSSYLQLTSGLYKLYTTQS